MLERSDFGKYSIVNSRADSGIRFQEKGLKGLDILDEFNAGANKREALSKDQ